MKIFIGLVIIFIIAFSVYIQFFFQINRFDNNNIVKKEISIIETNSINIGFDNEMNTGSVEQNLKMYPDLDKEFIWTNNKNLEIKIKNIPEKETFLILNIFKTAERLNGEKIENDIIREFKTRGLSKVDFISPEGEINDLSKNITVRFSKPMVGLSALNVDKNCPINISPDIEGECVWITTSTVQFKPLDGFPIGSKYRVIIPAGTKTLEGSEINDNKIFEIITPKLYIKDVSEEISKSGSILIKLNSEVDLDLFKENFELSLISGVVIDNKDLLIDYDKTKNHFNEIIEEKSTLNIKLINGDFGYNNIYNLKIKSGLKSLRGNVPLERDFIFRLKTNTFIKKYNTFSLEDPSLGYKLDNILVPKDINIISNNDHLISFYFSEEINVKDKIFFVSSDGRKLDFELFMPKEFENEMKKKGGIYEDMIGKVIFMRIKSNLGIKQKIDITLKTSDLGLGKDTDLSFYTTNLNRIRFFNLIDYKTICLSTTNPLIYNKENFSENINLGGNGEINYFNEVLNQNSGCKKIRGLYNYKMGVLLNPNRKIDIKISKNLYDINYSKLDKDYLFNVETSDVKNIDKYLGNPDSSNYSIVSDSLKTISLANLSKNIKKIDIEVCEGDLEVENGSEEIISNKLCNSAELMIDNNGFDLSYNNIDLASVYGRDFSKQVITVKVSKIENDKLNRKDDSYKKIFIRNNIIGITKTNSNKSYIWLYDLKYNSTMLENMILDVYAYNYKYNSDKKRYEYSDKTNIEFNKYNDELIELNLKDGKRYNFYLINLKNGEKLILDGIKNYSYNNLLTYINTDKPIYKPGDTINIKGYIRKDKPNGLLIDDEIKEIDIEIRDSNYNILKEDKVEVNINGGIDYSYILEDNSLLGRYTITIGKESSYIYVENYEKPDFKFEIKNNKDTYNFGDKTDIDILSEYYSGGPLSEGVGSYTIKSRDDNFVLGNIAGYVWGENNNYEDYLYPKTNEFNNISNGTFELDTEGKIKLSFDLKDEFDSRKDKNYEIDFTIKDPKTSKIVSKSVNFKVYNNKEYVGLKFDKDYYDFGENIYLNFLTVDRNSEPIINRQIDFKVIKTTYEYKGNSYKKIEEVLESKYLKTDIEGYLHYPYALNDYGEIRFEVFVPGSDFKTSKTLYIYGDPILKPKGLSNSLDISVKKEKYSPGEMGDVIIKSSLTGKALLTIEKLDGIIDYEIIDINKTPYIYNIPIKKDYLPNFYVNVTLIETKNDTEKNITDLANIKGKIYPINKKLRIILAKLPDVYNYFKSVTSFNPLYKNIDTNTLKELSDLRKEEKMIMENILPRYEYGSLKVKVETDLMELTTTVETNKTKYSPGDRQIINLKVKDNSNQIINGEAVVYIVDEALLGLKSTNQENIIDFFYGDKPNHINTSNLLDKFIKRIDLSELKRISSEESVLDSDKTSDPDIEKDIKNDLEDIAFYKGTVQVIDGKAKIEVDKLPDNLTKWIITGFVITNDTKLGMINDSFIVKKDLSLLPSLPRFFISQDEIEIKGIVLNTTSKDLEVKPKLEITNANIVSKAEEKIIVKGNTSSEITWKVKVGTKDKDVSWSDFYSDIKIGIESGKMTDILEFKRIIKPYSTYEYAFANGKTIDLSYEENIFLPSFIDKKIGSLEINIGPTILSNLNQDLLTFFPENIWFNNYYHIETLNKISNITNFYKVIGEENNIDNIKITDEFGENHSILELIEKSIKYFEKHLIDNRALSYSLNCKEDKCISLNYTIRVIDTLNKLEKAGYTTDSIEFKNKLISYVKDTIRNYEDKKPNLSDLMILLEASEIDFVKSEIEAITFGNSNLDKLYRIKFYRLLKEKPEEIKKLLSEFKNEILIESRGSLLTSDNKYENSRITGLALIEYLNSGEEEKIIIENFVSYLLSEREYSDMNTNSVIIEAITEYIKREVNVDEIDFIASAYLNSEEIMQYQFLPEDKFSKITLKLPLKDNVNINMNNPIGFSKKGEGTLYYSLGLNYFLPIEKIEARDEGMIITRNYYKLDEYLDANKIDCYEIVDKDKEKSCYNQKLKRIYPVKLGTIGEMLVGEVEITAPYERHSVLVENYIPAGAEILNSNLDIPPSIAEDIEVLNRSTSNNFRDIQIYDDKILMYSDKLGKGTYKYVYVIKLNHVGKYHNKPAIVKEVENPGIWGRTAGEYFEIK